MLLTKKGQSIYSKWKALGIFFCLRIIEYAVGFNGLTRQFASTDAFTESQKPMIMHT